MLRFISTLLAHCAEGWDMTNSAQRLPPFDPLSWYDLTRPTSYLRCRIPSNKLAGYTRSEPRPSIIRYVLEHGETRLQEEMG